MNKAFILMTIVGALLGACSKKEDSQLETTAKLQGAWTMSTKTQQGQVIVPVSKAKSLDQFGSSTTPTMQLEITNLSLRLIETDFVQVTATDYAFIVSNNTLILTNTTDPSAPQETITFELKNDNLTLNTINDGVLVFSKVNSQSLATKTALSIDKTQMIDLQYFVSLGGSSSSPLEIPTKGTMMNVQKPTDKVVIKCSYNHETKQATVFYSNIEDSPDTKINLVIGLDFNLATKSENSLFTSSGSIESDIYGKKMSGSNIQCAGSMSRVEFFTKLDMRCKGLSLEGASSSQVDFSGKVQCLF